MSNRPSWGEREGGRERKRERVSMCVRERAREKEKSVCLR